MSHSSAVINAGFYTLQNTKSYDTKNAGMPQYCLDEKDIFQRMLPIIPKVSKSFSFFRLCLQSLFFRIALLK